MTSTPHLRELAKGVHVWLGQSGDSNAGCIETTDGLIVIDAQQHRGLARQFRDEIESRLMARPRVLINTHYHLDHISGNVVFGDVPILAHNHTFTKLKAVLGEPNDGQWLITDTTTKIELFFGSNIQELVSEDDRAWTWFKERVASSEYKSVIVKPPSQTFTEQFTFHLVNETISLPYWGPAHCVGDIPVIVEKAKVAFLGDLLFCGRFPWLGDCDLDGWIGILDRILQLDLDIVVPGHGPPGTLAEVGHFRDLLSAIRSEVGAAIRAGMSEEAATRTVHLPNCAAMPRYREWMRFNARSAYRYLKGCTSS